MMEGYKMEKVILLILQIQLLCLQVILEVKT